MAGQNGIAPEACGYWAGLLNAGPREIADSGPLEFQGYMIREGVVLLSDEAGTFTQVGIGHLVNRDDLVSRLSPEDALRIGSWHGAWVERRNQRVEVPHA